MAESFKTLRAGMSATNRRRAARLARKLEHEIPLHELRMARQVSQVSLANALATRQSSVSRIESRTDIYLSTLRGYVEALGGKLEIRARFPDGSVKVLRFGKAAR